MGYSSDAVKTILHKGNLFRGKKIVTLGTLYPFMSNKELKKLEDLGVQSNIPKQSFSEHLFVDKLGAAVCHSLDVSDYQQSNIICNLNLPLPSELIGQYDVIIDAGTLEHLSNLSVAVDNLFKLLKVDGIYYFSVPCNNWIDHGFFQFSPTFFIDLCTANPCLELTDLHISTPQKTYLYDKTNALLKSALFSSNKKLTVGGIIKKNGSVITLDLTQKKYRTSYSANSFKTEQSSEKSIIQNTKSCVLDFILKTSLIPLGIKELIFKALYKFKNVKFESLHE